MLTLLLVALSWGTINEINLCCNCIWIGLLSWNKSNFEKNANFRPTLLLLLLCLGSSAVGRRRKERAGRTLFPRSVTWCPDTPPSTPCHLYLPDQQPPQSNHGHQQQGRVHLLHAEGLRGPVQRLLHRALQHPAQVVFATKTNIASEIFFCGRVTFLNCIFFTIRAFVCADCDFDGQVNCRQTWWPWRKTLWQRGDPPF